MCCYSKQTAEGRLPLVSGLSETIPKFKQKVLLVGIASWMLSIFELAFEVYVWGAYLSVIAYT